MSENDPLSGPPPELPTSRKTYWRSASWSSSHPNPSNNPNPNPNSQHPPLTPRSLSKSRSLLPPLSIARRSYDEWPNAGGDDVGEWNHPPTPSSRSNNSNTSVATCNNQIAFFDKECSKVADHIYLGGNSVARNKDILLKNGITHVLNCVGFVCPEYFRSDFVYKTLWLQDSPSEDIISILYDVFDYFEDVRSSGGRVFVHCCQGVSRSTSLVIAYLMWRKSQSFDDAFKFVKNARGIANPNMGFACQLLQCQKRVLAIPMSPSAVLRMYRMAPHSSYDPLHLVPKMVNEPKVEDLDSRGAFILHVVKFIYVWVGKDCDIVMEKDAMAAASQVVRYEKVSGPIVVVEEGHEPFEFWDAFSSIDDKDETKLEDRNNIDRRRVHSYDVDFELFYKAITGGIVPAFPSSGPGHETLLPARENSWSVLRRKCSLGTISRVHSNSAVVKDCDHRGNRVQILSTESSISPSVLSPSSVSSDSSASSKCCSDSPSISACSSPSLTPPNLLLDSFVSQAKPSNQIRGSLEHSKPLNSITSPSKGSPRSIAERRGNFSMKLPLNKNASPLSAVSPSVEGRNDILDRSNDNIHKSSDSPDGTGKYARGKSDDISIQLTESDGMNHSHILAYRWPDMKKLSNFSFKDLDHEAVVMFLTSDRTIVGNMGKKLFLWIGKSVEEADRHSLRNLNDADGQNEIWKQIGCSFLAQRGLPEDLPVKVIKNQEPEVFIQLLNHHGLVEDE